MRCRVSLFRSMLRAGNSCVCKKKTANEMRISDWSSDVCSSDLQDLDYHFLGPLGMHQSTFRFVSQEGPHADAQLAMGHFEGGATQAAVPLYLRPAGQFTTTASDMGLFARFLMSDGEIDGKPFIAPHLLQAMGRPTTTEAADRKSTRLNSSH